MNKTQTQMGDGLASYEELVPCDKCGNIDGMISFKGAELCTLCDHEHEMVLSVVKSKNIPKEDYRTYLKNGGFQN